MSGSMVEYAEASGEQFQYGESVATSETATESRTDSHTDTNVNSVSVTLGAEYEVGPTGDATVSAEASYGHE